MRMDGSHIAWSLGRPFWQLVYQNGTVVGEWECDWLEVNKRGVAAIRLLCPDGRTAEAGSDMLGGGDASGRVFQLKVARADAGAGGLHRQTLAHLVGLLLDTDGRCACAAWEWQEDGSGRLVTFRDHFHRMAWQQLGALSAENLGVAAR